MTSVVHHTLMTSAVPPQRWMLFLHGILGSGNNLRALARRWIDKCPGWGAVLVDLRLHGASKGMPPPHSIVSTAVDLMALEELVPGPIEGVTGHSFGGKVALEWIAQRRGRHLTALAWILDAMPGIRLGGRGSEGTLQIFDSLEQVGRIFSSRQQFVDRMVALGQNEGVALWLAMNLEYQGREMHLSLDLPSLRAMLNDYFTRDLWPIVEAPPAGLSLHLVIGGRSQVFDPAERLRAEQIAARSGGSMQVHVLPHAGHWVHVDDPNGLLDFMLAAAR